MKATLQGKIVRTENTADGEVAIDLESKGKVATTNVAAQMIILDGSIRMKQIIAGQIKLGSIITITITDEEAAL